MRETDRLLQVRVSRLEHEEIVRQADAKAKELGLPKLSLNDYIRWLVNYHRKEEEK